MFSLLLVTVHCLAITLYFFLAYRVGENNFSSFGQDGKKLKDFTDLKDWHEEMNIAKGKRGFQLPRVYYFVHDPSSDI
jgi:hypothetical protein